MEQGTASGFNQSEVSQKKVLCGILAIVIGCLGIHKFLLGYTTAGLIMLLVSVLFAGALGIYHGDHRADRGHHVPHEV